jgi:hypothetical protein
MKQILAGLFMMLLLMLAGLSGPLSLAASSKYDAKTDVFVLLSRNLPDAETHLSGIGVQAFGPISARFGSFVYADAQARKRAAEAGYVLIPAAALAALCGLDAEGIL